jgi:16S rRNA (cytosine967-C5)-methyltransferase
MAVREAARVVPSPALIVDACAGRGTKTRQLARAYPDARILATDTDARRRATLAEAFTGHPRVRVVAPAEVTGLARSRADLVVLDVPCSNTGVLARRVEARYRAGDAVLSQLVGLQRTIMRDADPWLAAGGHILYSTCSLEPEENEQQTAWAASNLGWKVGFSRATLPVGVPGGPARDYRDGSFAAVLSRG